LGWFFEPPASTAAESQPDSPTRREDESSTSADAQGGQTPHSGARGPTPHSSYTRRDDGHTRLGR
jgi:hypothetical protein